MYLRLEGIIGIKLLLALMWYGTPREIEHAGHLQLLPIKLLCTLSKYVYDGIMSVLAKNHVASKCLATSHCHSSVSVSDVLGTTALEATRRVYQTKMHGAKNV